MAKALDGLELARGGAQLCYRHDGVRHTLPDPVAMSYEEILHALASDGRSLRSIPPMPGWKLALLIARWAAHHDLGTLQQAQRLCYLLERYSPALESDLRVHAAGADLGALWRARRWRYLLNLIDHLPRHSHYAEAVANDPEHAEMLIKASEARQADPDAPAYNTGPALHTWTPEVSLLTDVLDAIRSLNYTLVAVNSGKGQRPKPPEPSPRPTSALTLARKKAEEARRQSAHQSLVSRMLPHKAKAAGPGRDTPSPARPPVAPVAPGTAWLRKKAQVDG